MASHRVMTTSMSLAVSASRSKPSQSLPLPTPLVCSLQASKHVYFKFICLLQCRLAVTFNDIHKFDRSTLQWTTVDPLLPPAAPRPSPRYNHGFLAYDDALYVFGGWDGAQKQRKQRRLGRLVQSTSSSVKGLRNPCTSRLCIRSRMACWGVDAAKRLRQVCAPSATCGDSTPPPSLGAPSAPPRETYARRRDSLQAWQRPATDCCTSPAGRRQVRCEQAPRREYSCHILSREYQGRQGRARSKPPYHSV